MSAVLDALNASLGPSVAILGVAVALAQWRTNDVKLRLDCYDRRLNVYKAAVRLLDALIAEIDQRRGPRYLASNNRPERIYQGLPAGVYEAYCQAMVEAPFLFDEEVSYFLRSIDRQRGDIQRYATLVSGHTTATSQGKSDQSNRHNLRQAEERVRKSHAKAVQVFSPYLKLERSRK